MALITRYKLLVAQPDVPAGEILAKTTGNHAYRGETNTAFWVGHDVVESDPLTYQFVSVTDNSGVAIVDIKSTARLISKTAFMDRITDAELATLMGAKKTSNSIAAWIQRFDAKEGDINLDSATLLQGLQALEAAGLLAAGRAVQIVS